jgi:hypothetical protein
MSAVKTGACAAARLSSKKELARAHAKNLRRFIMHIFPPLQQRRQSRAAPENYLN